MPAYVVPVTKMILSDPLPPTPPPPMLAASSVVSTTVFFVSARQDGRVILDQQSHGILLQTIHAETWKDARELVMIPIIHARGFGYFLESEAHFRCPETDWGGLIHRLMAQSAWSARRIAAALGVPESTLRSWQNDGCCPNYEDGAALRKLAGL